MEALLTKTDDTIISVRELYKFYHVGEERVKALNGVDFDVAKGEFCAIVGTSGSGKSTLLNMLAGLEPPTHGSVVINGKNIVGLSEKALVRFRRDQVGFVFQSFNLIQSLTAVENVALPLAFRGEGRRSRERKAKMLLYMMGLQNHLHHKPKEMSGGQQQRVGIARALVVHPSIIFADEPTGNLDSHTSTEIMDLLQGISKRHQQTMIMVTHDDRLAQYADRIIRILDGRIVSVETGAERYEVRQARAEAEATASDAPAEAAESPAEKSPESGTET